jgi:hypothetical protein
MKINAHTTLFIPHVVGLLVLCMAIPRSAPGQLTPKGANNLVPLDLKIMDGDIVPCFYIKAEANGDAILVRHKDSDTLIYRVPILWLTDEQARLLNLDKNQALSRLARLATSDKVEDKKALTRLLVIEDVDPHGPKKQSNTKPK